MEIIKSKNPLHGITLEKIVTELQAKYGWQRLGEEIRIKCFNDNPSLKSSLVFLRRTPWARKKVESLYLFSLEHGLSKEKPLTFKFGKFAADEPDKTKWPDLEL
ncbi:MAG: VF530 family protein [Patescibacteria group bacterium]|nr:VF530 family protein [Patescibacteria group bacterium]